MMKTFNMNFCDLSTDFLLRFGCQTIKLQYNIDNYFKEKSNYIKLKEVFDILSGFAFKSEDYESDGIALYRITNVGNEDKDFVYLNEDYKDIYKKFLLKTNDITIGLTGDGKIKVDKINTNNELLLNQRVGVLRAKNNSINIKFYFYLLKYGKIVAEQFLYKSNGKTQLNISPNDLLNIKIPLVPLSTQNEIVEKIKPIEEKIASLKAKIKDQKLIINEVFAKEFEFDTNLYNEFGKGMTAGTQIANDKTLRVFSINFNSFDKSYGCRFSTRFHNETTRKLMSILNNMKTKKLKEITTSIDKGVQPEYDQDGDYNVIKIANLKNSYVDYVDCEKINENYFNSLNKEKILKENDIILCCTGKISLGKIDIIENNEQNSVTAIDNLVLRINNYNCLFLVYFFRSVLGCFQVERDYTGTTNQIHLYSSEISNFLIPDISLSKQQTIVDEIKAEIDKQNEVNETLAYERKKIDELIESVLE